MITDFRLKVFKTVADRLSFTRAAEELLITQPAVTKHINELERQLSTPLFLRRGNRIELTEQGTRLLHHANRLLTLYESLNDDFAENQPSLTGELSMGASTTISQYLLPTVLAKFKRRYPDVRLRVVNGNTEQIERMILARQLDFGLIEGSASENTLHYEPFLQDELVLVTAIDNRSIEKEELSVQELRNVPLVIRENGSGTLKVIEEALAKQGITLRDLSIEMQLGSSEGIKRYLLASDAAAFISIQAVLEELAQGKLRVVECEGVELTRQFRFVSEHGRHGRLFELFKLFCINQYKHRL